MEKGYKIIIIVKVGLINDMVLEEINNIDNVPGLTSGTALNMYESAVICLQRQNHHPGCDLYFRGSHTYLEELCWTENTDTRLDRAYKDQEEATELGAVCISILAALKNTPYTVVERARKKTGVDYWLGNKGEILFTHSARLEVSGIFNNPGAVSSRLRVKQTQITQSNATRLPAYIAIVEFSEPSINLSQI